jgi:arylsulfatase A-like enzyme
MYTRREFLKHTALGVSALYALPGRYAFGDTTGSSPNLLFVFADQLRAQTLGYAGCPDIDTPNFDSFAAASVNYANAVSTFPVCSPYRAMLITGQYPLSQGVIINDLHLNENSTSIAQAYNAAGYSTGFIGKWHIDGNGRSNYIPPERRQGFDYWKVLECTHIYNDSKYYAGDDPTQLTWPDYDAYSQTDDAIQYLNDRAADQVPFALFLAWGPPHNDYRTGPADLVAKYDAMKDTLTLRDNVSSSLSSTNRLNLCGYYAHTEALDISFGRLMDTLAANGLDQNTIVVFTSDHGDMLYSHNMTFKQRPWDESVRVPFLIRVPGNSPKTIDVPLGTPDLMPTLLSLSGVTIPDTCEGQDLSGEILGSVPPPDDRATLILNPCPSGATYTLQEWRGVRTKRYTYIRDLNGPWLLYDNQTDPYQMTNIVNDPTFAAVQADLEQQLQTLLCQTGDTFQSRSELVARCGYIVNSTWGPAVLDQASVPCRESALVCGVTADAGVDMITWSGEPVQLTPTVVNINGGAPPAGLIYAWSADPDAGVVFSATDVQAPTVTITKAAGDPLSVTLTLSVSDGVTAWPLVDTVTIDVYDDACQAAIGKGLRAENRGDIDGNCKTNLEDLAELAQKWMTESTGLPGPVPKP